MKELDIDELDIDELNVKISPFLKDGIKLEEMTIEQKKKAYEQAFNKKIAVKQYFIQCFFYNPCSHETEWIIVSDKEENCVGEENGKYFPTEIAAQLWTHTDEAKKYRPCRFEIKKSEYKL